MRRYAVLIVILAIAVIAVIAVPAAHARHLARVTCRSGTTEFRFGRLRVFHVSRWDPRAGALHEELLLCATPSSRPRIIVDDGPDVLISTLGFALRGARLAAVVQTVSGMNPVAIPVTEVGWIDVRRGGPRLGVLSFVGTDPAYTAPDEPLLPIDSVHVAIAPDGSTAVIAAAKSGCQVVAELAIRSHKTLSGELLGPVAVLYTAPQGGLDPGSLTIDNTTVHWRTIAGAPGSAQRSAGTPATGSPAAQSGGC